MTHGNDAPPFDDDDLAGADKRYETNLARTRGSLPGWRTLARRRLLVRLLWVSMVTMAAIAIGGYFWFPIIVAWLPMTAAVVALWIMLRIVIDARDTAPAHYLDELEAATLLEARSRALNLISTGMFVISIVLIFGASFEVGDGHRLAYTMGALGILTFLSSAISPASAMARTMDPGEDDDPTDPTR